jgi:hypothetical protein
LKEGTIQQATVTFYLLPHCGKAMVPSFLSLKLRIQVETLLSIEATSEKPMLFSAPLSKRETVVRCSFGSEGKAYETFAVKIQEAGDPHYVEHLDFRTKHGNAYEVDHSGFF